MSLEEKKKKLTELILTIAQIKKMHAVLMGKVLSQSGITYEQWVVLRTLNLHEPLTAKFVAEFSEKDSSTITRVLDQLEKKKLIERKKNKKDRRSIIVHLTGSGDDIAQFVSPREDKIFARVIRNIALMEITEAVDAFQKILTNQQDLVGKAASTD